MTPVPSPRTGLEPLPEDAPWRTIVGQFEAVAARGARPAFTATSAAGEVVTSSAAQLSDVVARAASLLAASGADAGTTVGVHLDNRAGFEALVLHWATQWLGAAAVPLGTRLARPEVEYIVGHAGISLLCSGQDQLALAQAVGATTGTRVLDVSGGLVGLVARHAARSGAPVTEHDLADVLHTSGTTGRPKGVELTHANNVAAGLELVHACDLTADDVYQSAIPYFTSTGVHTNPLACLASGAHLVVEPGFDQHRMLPTEAGEPAAPDELGEIVLRSPAVMRGYATIRARAPRRRGDRRGARRAR